MKVAKQLAMVAGIAVLAAGTYMAVDHYWVGSPTGQAASTKGGGGKGRGPRERLVELAKPEMRPIEVGIDAVGTSRARQSIEVVSLADGRVAAIEFTSGQKVAAGDVLVRLDSDIEQADLTQAQAMLKEAELAMSRATTLQERRAGKQSTVDEMVAKLATARAGLDRSGRRLKDRTVRAPFGGVVGIRRIDVGARVDNKTVLTTLDDLSAIDIDFLVPEDRFSQISRGQTVVANTAAFPGRSFSGTVSTIDSRIDQVGRAFKVRATVPNPDGALPPGLFMLVRVVMERRERLTVPEAAIVPEAGRNLVYIVENGKAVAREVKVGQRERGMAEIQSGLGGEEAVVVKGFASLRNGVQVRIAGKGGTGGKGSGRKGGPGKGKASREDETNGKGKREPAEPGKDAGAVGVNRAVRSGG